MKRSRPWACALLVVAGCMAGCAGSPSASTTFTQLIICGFGGGSTQMVGDVDRTAGVQMACRVESSDPRASGNQTGTVAIEELPDGSGHLWHTYRLANDGGSWEGASTGLIAAGYGTHRIHVIATGTGGYAGLRLELDVVTASDTTSADYTSIGTIRPDR